MVQMMLPGCAVEQIVPYRNESHPVAPDVSQHLARITKKMGKKFAILVCSRKPCEVQKSTISDLTLAVEYKIQTGTGVL